MPEALTILAILFTATVVSSTFGFGSALVAMPLLSLVVDLRLATPLFALVAAATGALIIGGSWQHIDLKAAWRLIVSTLAGIPVGIVLLRTVPQTIVIHGLGGFLILFGLYRLSQSHLPILYRASWAYPFGFVAGILGGAYNTNGPPVVVYGNMCRWTPERFRATLQGYFFSTGIAIVISHALTGLWTADVFRLFGLAMPLVVAAVWVGQGLNQRFSPERFERILFFLLIALGSLLLTR